MNNKDFWYNFIGALVVSGIINGLFLAAVSIDRGGDWMSLGCILVNAIFYMICYHSGSDHGKEMRDREEDD